MYFVLISTQFRPKNMKITMQHASRARETAKKKKKEKKTSLYDPDMLSFVYQLQVMYVDRTSRFSLLKSFLL